jgi:2-oxo-4-hydroxy-4-carboxy-5-ureidoimidazoline decarboxylase
MRPFADSSITLKELNCSDRKTFIDLLSDAVENAPWVAAGVEKHRPFHSVDLIWRAIMSAIASAPFETQVELFRGHPELAGTEAMTRRMSSDSTREQDRLGLTTISSDQAIKLRELNRLYRLRFGYPCIVALRHKRDIAEILATIHRRLANDPALEREITLREIGEIVRGRQADHVGQIAQEHGVDHVGQDRQHQRRLAPAQTHR